MGRSAVGRRGRGFVLAAAMASAALFGAPSGAWAVTVCGGGGCDYTSINTAVATEPSGTTFDVKQGVYMEDVTIPDTKFNDVLLGAQATNDARSRSGNNESEVVGGFNVLAAGTTIDGFTIRDNDGPGIATDFFDASYTILNNIIKNNVLGIKFETKFTQPSTVRQNLIKDNNTTGTSSGNGLLSSMSINNTTIDDNEFSGHNVRGINIFGTPNSQLTVTDNSDDAGGFEIQNAGSVEVSNNTITNVSNSAGSDALAFFNGTDTTINDNTISNPGDSGVILEQMANVTNEGNTITGADVAIEVAGGVAGLTITGDSLKNNNTGVRVSGSPSNASVEITGNTIVNNDNDGLLVEDGGHTGSVEFHFNRVVGNGGNSGVENQDTNDDVDAENNWWGCNAGPGVSGQGCDGVEGDVAFNPWLVLSIEANPTTIKKKTGTSDITASLLVNSDGNEPSGNNFPDGTTVTFAAKKKCKLSGPSSDNTQNGEAESEVKAKNDVGTCKAKAFLDNQKVKAIIDVVKNL
jgi:hypothetical protein